MNRTVALRRTTTVLAGLMVAACSGDTPPPSSSSKISGSLAPLATAPPSSGKPLVLGHLATPDYPREPPAGTLAFVVDSEVGAVYEFDLGRRRFLGPAPLIGGIGRMPGYPTVLGTFAPQGAVVIGQDLYVADGDAGSVSRVALTSDGLAGINYIDMPSITLTLPPDEGGGTAPSATRFISHLVGLSGGEILALGKDRVNGIGLAYAVDPESARVTGSLQLPFGYPQAAAFGSGRTVVAMDGKQLLVAGDKPLAIVKAIALGGVPHGVALVDHWAFVAIDSPARLLKVDLDSGASTTLDSVRPNGEAISGQTGPVTTDGSTVWWSIKTGEVREVPLASRRQPRSFHTCKYVNSLTLAGRTLLVTCLDRAQLVLIELEAGRIYATRAGYFPSAIVVSPAAP